MASIYAIIDSRLPNEYRYVGKTIGKISLRLYFHLYRAARCSNRHKGRWIAKVQAEGGTVESVLLESCDDSLQDEREIFWIAKCKAEGHPLTNLTAGGEGGVPCAEVREKISVALRGRSRPPHVVEAIRQRGKLLVGSLNHNFGKTHTAEARAKISATHSGRILSEEHKKKLSEAGKGLNSGSANGRSKLTSDQVEKIYIRIVIGKEQRRTVADDFGIHEMSTYKITTGVKWPHLRLKERFG